MYNHAIENRKLPESLKLVQITVLPKPGKGPKLCSSYAAIFHFKIFSKILSLWLEKNTPWIEYT